MQNPEFDSNIEELEPKIAPFSMMDGFNEHMGMGSHSGFLDCELGPFDFYSEHSGAGFLE